MVDKTAEELKALGVEVDYLTPLSRSFGDVVHFFGCFDAHWGVAELAQQRGVPIVWTPIYNSPRGAFMEGVRGFRKRATRSFPRLVRKLADASACIVTLTGHEETLLQAFFQMGTERFRRIPHGVEARFASGDPELFREQFGIEGEFVLHVGSFTPEKNQLGLIQALKGTGIRLVLVGPAGAPAYNAHCKQHESDFVRLLGPIDHGGPLLPSAYSAATVFALPSRVEVFPLTALEAAVAGCGLVLSDTWGANETYGEYARCVSPGDSRAIREAITDAMAKGRGAESQSIDLLKRFSWPAVTADLKAVYEDLMV